MCYSEKEVAGSYPGCPCGKNPGPVCNSASVCASCQCQSCHCELPERICAESGQVCTHIVAVQLIKTVTPACVCRGQEVLYTVAVKNCSSLPLQEVVITDPQAAKLLQVGVIRVNGIAVSGNLTTGIEIPAIGPGGSAVLTFHASPLAGSPAIIENVAYAHYRFTTICGGEEAGSATSNTAQLTVLEPGIAITKEADRCHVTPEEPVITYLLTATNTGNVPLQDVVVTDHLPARLDYVSGSTRVNGGLPVDRNPEQGIHVGTLPAGGHAQVEFQAELDCEE